MRAYNITAPEEIAKEYGGNKKKIQQAASQGIISPTEAVMAGMFIDRMRNAAAQEQAQQPSVAEQVMNPQPPMPPQAQMGAPMQRMAMGGGVDSIPFDEGDYAEGGIVGFSKGVSLTKEQMLNLLEQQYLAAGSAQERADIEAQIDNLKKMGTVTSPGGQAVTDSRLNQSSSFTGAVPLAETNLSETNLFDQLKNAEPAAIPGETARQARILAATGSPYPDVQQAPGQLGFQLPAIPVAPRDDSTQYPADVVSGSQYPDVPTEMGQLDFQLPAVKGSPGQAVPIEEGLSAGLAATDVGRRIIGKTRAGTPIYAGGEQAETDIIRGRSATREEFGTDPIIFTPTLGTSRRDKRINQQAAQIQRAMQEAQMEAGLIPTARNRGAEGEQQTAIQDLSNQFVEQDENNPPTANQVKQQPTLADQVKEVNKATEDLKPNTVNKGDPDAAETALDAANREADAMTNAAQNTANDDFQQQIEDLMEPAEKGEFRKEMEALVKDRGKRLKSAKKEAFSMALLQAGLGMLGQGGGQTALQALGKAALPATKQYASAIKDAKKEDRELLQLGLSMEQMDAKELAATKRAVAQLYGKRSAAMLQSATSQANNIRTTATSKYSADASERVGMAKADAMKAQAEQTAGLRKDLSRVENLRMERAELNDLVDKQAQSVAEDGGVRIANTALMGAQSKLAKDPQNETLRAEFILAQEELRKAQEAAIARSIYTPLIQEQRGVVQSLGTSAVDFSSLNP